MSTSRAIRPGSPTPAGSSDGISFRISPAGSNACSRNCVASAGQRRRVSRSRLPPVVRAPEQDARLCAQLRRAVQLSESPARGMGEGDSRIRQGLQGVGEGRYPAILDFTPYGEMLPNQVRMSTSIPSGATVRLPLARRHVHWGEQRGKAVQRHGAVEPEDPGACGRGDPDGPRRPGYQPRAWRLPHGPGPRTSVVNRGCRTHDVPNLYVVDGSVFPSASEKNPTHTIMALAARAADHIAGRMKRGEL